MEAKEKSKGGGVASAAAASGGKDAKPKQKFAVERYLILFLKFISSVIPTIEYDYTTEV